MSELIDEMRLSRVNVARALYGLAPLTSSMKADATGCEDRRQGVDEAELDANKSTLTKLIAERDAARREAEHLRSEMVEAARYITFPLNDVEMARRVMMESISIDDIVALQRQFDAENGHWHPVADKMLAAYNTTKPVKDNSHE